MDPRRERGPRCNRPPDCVADEARRKAGQELRRRPQQGWTRGHDRVQGHRAAQGEAAGHRVRVGSREHDPPDRRRDCREENERWRRRRRRPRAWRRHGRDGWHGRHAPWHGDVRTHHSGSSAPNFPRPTSRPKFVLRTKQSKHRRNPPILRRPSVTRATSSSHSTTRHAPVTSRSVTFTTRPFVPSWRTNSRTGVTATTSPWMETSAFSSSFAMGTQSATSTPISSRTRRAAASPSRSPPHSLTLDSTLVSKSSEEIRSWTRRWWRDTIQAGSDEHALKDWLGRSVPHRIPLTTGASEGY